jgi:superfamily I DNA/RNA helicase
MTYYFRLPKRNDLTIGQQSALLEKNSICVSGGPGTGKSVVVLWRHIRNHNLHKRKSLLLTYTKTLEAYLVECANTQDTDAGFNVGRTYHWMNDSPRIFDEIIIDEAQDVNSFTYVEMKKYSQSISYGADDGQIVFPENASTENQLKYIFPSNSSYVLGENFRNSYEIMIFIRSIFPNRLVPQETINNLLQKGIRGNKPILLVSNFDLEKQKKAVIDVINQFKSDTHNIAILVPFKSKVNYYYELIQKNNILCSKYESDDESITVIENIHITTFKSAKGTEFDTVIIPDFEEMLLNITRIDVVKENDYFVAFTRARRNLYLISNNDLSFMNFSNEMKSTFQKVIL